MSSTRPPPDTDIDKLTSLKAFSWLSASELRLLAGALAIANFKRLQVILREGAFAHETHILLRGIVRITCQNGRGERVTIALLARGRFPSFLRRHLESSTFDARLTMIAELAV